MATRYQIRGETSKWFLFWRLFFLAGTAVCAVVAFNSAKTDQRVAFTVFGCMSFLIVLVLECNAAIRRWQRAFLEVLEDGFIVTDRRGTRQYRDAQVKAMAFSTKQVLNNGNAAGYKRTAKIWLSDEPAPVVCENRIKLNETDPLDAFFRRLLDLLSKGFDQALEHGLLLEGDGWSLSKTELSYTNNGKRETIPISEIAVVEAHDEKMGIWRRGDEMPCAQFPVAGKNVWLLRNVLTPRLTKDVAPVSTTALGRVLFERKARTPAIVVLIFVALLAAVPGVFVLLTARKEQYIGAIFVLIGIGVALWTIAYSRTRFRCHEVGVFQKTAFGQKQLLYNNVKAFTYTATRHYHNGAYVGTHVRFVFEPLSVAEFGGRVAYATSVNGSDQELDRLRDFISNVIARRMQNELAAGGRVDWTSNIAFLERGFEYHPAGILARKDAVFMPNEKYGGWNMNAGQFQLFEKLTAAPGEKEGTKVVFKEATSSRNFFPGFALLRAKFHNAPL